jgi:uncharacterized protein (AIM24 family)
VVQSAEDDTQEPESERPSGAAFDGEDFLFHLYRGSELLQDNCVAEAKEELERALSMQPRDIEGQGLLGVVYFRLGLYPRAIQIYEDIIRLCPDEVTPRVNLALCYLKTGQPLLAREALEQVIRRVSGHTRAWGYLGLVFERMGDHAKAMAAFERAGQPQMARRMQQLLEAMEEPARDLNPPEQAELRAVAADAVQELDGEEPPGPFLAVEANDAAGAPSRAGRWRATEPGEELVPPPSRPHRPGSLAGRFGPAVPSLTPTIPPGPPETPQAEFNPPVPVSALAAQGLLGAPQGLHVALRPDGVLLVRIEENFTARVDALRAVVPAGRAMNTAIVRRRARGRELEEPLGGLGAPLVSFEGNGTLVLSVPPPKRVIAVQLGEEFLYVREELLVGFDASVRHENGRLATGAVDAVAMVQLSGRGAVVFEMHRGLRAVEVAPDRALTVRAEDVIGWTGRMLAQPLGADQAPGALPGFVGFTGDGTVLLDLV